MSAIDERRAQFQRYKEDVKRRGKPFYPWAMFHGPSLSVPCGFHETSGMPIGAHLTARPWREDLLLMVAHAFQRRTEFHRAVSPLCQSAATSGAASPQKEHD